MYFRKVPSFAFPLFSSCVWKKDDPDAVYLTFDDGPDPDVTPDVLNLLGQFDAKATFFLRGDAVTMNPELAGKIAKSGNRIGNHSFSHPDGWKTGAKDYLEDVVRGADAIASVTGSKPILFRPPYGRITYPQFRLLRKQYQIVMWDLMPGDFSGEKAFRLQEGRMLAGIRPGSIIVLHDTLRCRNNMLPFLKKVLQKYSAEGLSFKAL